MKFSLFFAYSVHKKDIVDLKNLLHAGNEVVEACPM